jgi:hypothetical protein
MKLPEESELAAKVYAKNMKDFEYFIKVKFRKNGQKWVTDVGFEEEELEYPGANIEEGYMSWTNDEIFGCFDPVCNRVVELINNQITSVMSLSYSIQVRSILQACAVLPGHNLTHQ